ncbi:amylo-alpha-1,6-glucosidase [Athalassotoga sp.]|uniref:amylo-alpha-1,6-glucosidase n=1 Tax=Athalassotoga sp. TaxID=2022597 RepID=UPI003CFF594A
MYTIKSGNIMALIGDNGFIEGNTCGLYFMDTRIIGKMVPELSLKFNLLGLGEYRTNSVFFWFISKSPDSLHDMDLILKLSYSIDKDKFTVKSEFFNYSKKEVCVFENFVIDYTFNDIFEIRSGKFEDKKNKITKNQKESVKYESQHLQIETKIHGSISNEVNLKPHILNSVKFSIIPSVHFKIQTKGTMLFDNVVNSNVNLNLPHFKGKIMRLVKKSTEDLEMLLLDTKYGKFPAAGLPWFATIFGRDSLIFTLQTMDIFPEISYNILKVLAMTQSNFVDDQKDALPGKIIHEIRVGEDALSGKVPFSTYYGSIDATPLFLMAVGKYSKLYGKSVFKELKDAIELSARYIDENIDSRGYLYYKSKSSNGLSNQGWKDSGDSMVFSDGKVAQPPVRLVEVQGYLYEAYQTLSQFYDGERSLRYLSKAELLKKNFNEDFWMEKEKFFALALDKDERQVDSITSNPGHCLMTGIIDNERSKFIVDRLMKPDMFTGFGIRTMSSKMVSYNPISYHNGSVWPHDTSITMIGMWDKNFKREAKTLGKSLLDVAEYFEWRLPELFGGNQKKGKNIIPYPVACSPQLWSVGAGFVISKILKEGSK